MFALTTINKWSFSGWNSESIFKSAAENFHYRFVVLDDSCATWKPPCQGAVYFRHHMHAAQWRSDNTWDMGTWGGNTKRKTIPTTLAVIVFLRSTGTFLLVYFLLERPAWWRPEESRPIRMHCLNEPRPCQGERAARGAAGEWGQASHWDKHERNRWHLGKFEQWLTFGF